MTAKLFSTDSVQTYSEFEQNALRVADVLGENGIGHGCRVMLKAGNSAGWVVTLLALMHAGASIVMVDSQERADQTRRIATQAGVKMCLVDEDAPLDTDESKIFIYELLVAAANRTPLRDKLDFTDWAERPDGLIMWSSGSTGTPKGIVKSGRKFLDNLRRNAAQVGHREGDVLMPLLPFSHQYGLSMVLIAWQERCSLVVAPYRRIDRALVMAGQTGVTVIDATPSTYRSLLNIVEKRPEAGLNVDTVRMFCSGAAPLDPSLTKAYVDKFGLPLLDSYGSTEMGNVSFATPENPVACGQAMEGLEIKVVDDEGHEVPADEIGEVLVSTPDVMEGYLAEDGTLVPHMQTWFQTGDFGKLDEHGNLSVFGRKFAVTRMGYTLYPEIIERKVAEKGCSAKVVSVPDERRGCQLVFFVEDSLDREPNFWRELLAEVLPVYERPNRVHVLDQFPLNRNGKPDRLHLEQLALNEIPDDARV
jgi:acyl-coenzyme A synthetase/AMP-(fatty) acid ligase